MATFNDKVKFAKSLPIRTVCTDIGGVDFRGRRYAQSPLRKQTGKGSSNFSIDENRNVFRDWGYPVASGNASGDPIDFIRYLLNVDFGPAVEYLWDWYHKGDIERPVATKSFAPQARREAEDLALDKLSLAYEIFLNLAILDDRSKAVLRARNLSDEEIDYYGFKTFPKRLIKGELTNKLNENGIQPASVPGLYVRNDAKKEASFKFYDAIVIPVKTVDNYVAGLQLRFFNTGEGPRYIWFSSSNCTGTEYVFDGKPPGTPLGFVDKVLKNERTLFITEGMFKAIAINKCYGCPVISVQGVGNFNGIEETLHKVFEKYPRINRILIAYDADFIGNVNVTAHAVRLYETMRTEFPGMKYEYLMWDEEKGKGFDDLIANTGGWNVSSIVKPIEMSRFEAAFEEFKPTGIQLMQEGKRDEIAAMFKKLL